MTAELGCITPVVIVPGEWSEKDLEFKARHQPDRSQSPTAHFPVTRAAGSCLVRRSTAAHNRIITPLAAAGGGDLLERRGQRLVHVHRQQAHRHLRLLAPARALPAEAPRRVPQPREPHALLPGLRGEARSLPHVREEKRNPGEKSSQGARKAPWRVRRLGAEGKDRMVWCGDILGVCVCASCLLSACLQGVSGRGDHPSGGVRAGRTQPLRPQRRRAPVGSNGRTHGSNRIGSADTGAADARSASWTRSPRLCPQS